MEGKLGEVSFTSMYLPKEMANNIEEALGEQQLGRSSATRHW